jgi:hypothetical protein
LFISVKDGCRGGWTGIIFQNRKFQYLSLKLSYDITKNRSCLNQQVALEAESSQIYLAMVSWAEVEGYEGTSAFLFSSFRRRENAYAETCPFY